MAPMPPVPISVCYLNTTKEIAQDFCQLAGVHDCNTVKDKDPGQFLCYMPCGEGGNYDDEELYKCEDYDMVCHHDIICVLPPHMMDKDEEDGS
jgi:hypothetical protein